MKAATFLTVCLCLFFCGPSWARPFNSATYCFKPCKSTLRGDVQIKHVDLDDPKMTFKAYMLVLNSPISVPESGPFQGVSGEDHVQLEFIQNKKKLSQGECVTVSGELTGAITAYDIGDLVMQVDSYSRCK